VFKTLEKRKKEIRERAAAMVYTLANGKPSEMEALHKMEVFTFFRFLKERKQEVADAKKNAQNKKATHGRK
jgi:hypothetical protein